VEHLIGIPILDEELPKGRRNFFVQMKDVEVVVIDDVAGDKDDAQVVGKDSKEEVVELEGAGEVHGEAKTQGVGDGEAKT